MTHTSLVLAGRYRLEERVATGAGGPVWRATDLVLSRPVAVKLLRPEYAQHPEVLARFRAEARHAAAVTHPGIAQVYDYGEDGAADSPYLVMELVDGPSLAGLLTGGPLDPGDTMDVLGQAAAGLAAAHAAGLVHRDITPGNLLVGRDGQVKITDFGIAYAAGSAPLTRTGTLVGTPTYLPPERAAGGPATPASDLYSLGIVGYQCLTGSTPFSGPPLEVAAAHRHLPLPPLPAAVPAGVAGLIADLTAKDPAARPASAGDVARRARQLRDALAGTATAVLASEPGGAPGATRVDAVPMTLAGLPPPGGTLAHSGPERDGRRPRRGVLLAAAFASPSARQPTAPRVVPAAPSARTVEVNAAALTGQRARLVIQRLRQLGLHPHVVWAADGGQEPGTVISVQPNGQVRPGSIITVTAALRPPGQRDHHGHRGDGGGGNGQGGGNGGD